MSVENVGGQEIIWKFQTPLKSKVLGTFFDGVIDPGLITAPEVVNIDGYTVTLGLMSLFFETLTEDGKRLLGRVTTSTTVEVGCADDTVAIGYYYDYVESPDWYGDFVALSQDDIDFSEHQYVILGLVDVVDGVGTDKEVRVFSGKSFGTLSDRYCKENGIPEGPHFDVGFPGWGPYEESYKILLFLQEHNKIVLDHTVVCWDASASSYVLALVPSFVSIQGPPGFYAVGVKVGFQDSDSYAFGAVRYFFGASEQEALNALPLEFSLFCLVYWGGSIFSVGEFGGSSLSISYYQEKKSESIRMGDYISRSLTGYADIMYKNLLAVIYSAAEAGLNTLILRYDRPVSSGSSGQFVLSGGSIEIRSSDPEALGVKFSSVSEGVYPVVNTTVNCFLLAHVEGAGDEAVVIFSVTDNPGIWDPVRVGFYVGDDRVVGHGLTNIIPSVNPAADFRTKGNHIFAALHAGYYGIRLVSGSGGGSGENGKTSNTTPGAGGSAYFKENVVERVVYSPPGNFNIYLGGDAFSGGSGGAYRTTGSGSTKVTYHPGPGGGAGEGEASTLEYPEGSLITTGTVPRGSPGVMPTGYNNSGTGTMGPDGSSRPVGDPNAGFCEIYPLWLEA
jgi:hypothetical protein